MHKSFLTIILVLGSIWGLHAQDKRFEYADSSLLIEPGETSNNDEIPAEEKDILSDTAIYINRIHISPDTVAGWKNDKRFAYVNNLDSLLQNKQQEDKRPVEDELPKEKENSFFKNLFASGVPQLIFWGVAIAFVLFIIYSLFLSNGVFRKGTTAATSENTAPEEDLMASEADYDKLIGQSVSQGNYRLAVRYLFLKNLVCLGNREHIHYSPDKTNYQYVQEIRADMKNEFASLVLNYEYVWYGNFPLGSEAYNGMEKKFSSFYNKIQ